MAVFFYVHGDIIIEYCDQKRTCGATKILSFSFGSVDKFLDVFIADLYAKCRGVIFYVSYNYLQDNKI